MNCHETRMRLEEAFDLGREIVSEVQAHLEVCRHCRRYADDLAAIDAGLHTLTCEAVPPEIAQRVVDAVSRARHRQRRISALLGVGLVAASILVGFVLPFEPAVLLNPAHALNLLAAAEDSWTHELNMPAASLLDLQTWTRAWFVRLAADASLAVRELDTTLRLHPWSSNAVLASAGVLLLAFQGILSFLYGQRLRGENRQRQS